MGDTSVRSVLIRSAETVELPKPHTVYRVEVFTHSNRWVLLKRFSEFVELQTKLTKLYNVPKDLFPPKRFVRSMTEQVITERKAALERALQTLVNGDNDKVKQSPELAAFLEVAEHDVVGVSHQLAAYLYDHGDEILASGVPYSMSPVELAAVCKRLRLPNVMPGTVKVGLCCMSQACRAYACAVCACLYARMRAWRPLPPWLGAVLQSGLTPLPRRPRSSVPSTGLRRSVQQG